MKRTSPGAALIVCCVIALGCGDDVAPGTALTSGNNANNANNTSTNSCEASGAESCDALDNDCDGAVDEDFGLQSDVGNCGQCGRICAFDNGRASCVLGECALAGCLPGWFNTDQRDDNGCEAQDCAETNGGVEACDRADNDCDGETDEGFEVGASAEHCFGCGEPCALPNAEVACASGVCTVSDCAQGWVDGNGRDDDGCEEPRCEGSAGDDEVCDAADNDCDGAVDEGIDLTRVDRCGGCEIACAFDHGEAACVELACALVGCEQGWVDANGRADDGCEYACLPFDPADEEIACDDEDNDCDGEVDNGTLEGSACSIGERLPGQWTCTEQGLQCVPEPPEQGIAELCGAISGRLTAASSPYELVCPTLEVPAGQTLWIEPGVELRTGLGVQHVRLNVRGTLQSGGAAWRGVEVSVEGGDAELNGDMLEPVASGQALLVVPDPGSARLFARGVTLDGRGRAARGLVLGVGAFLEGRFLWDGGGISNLGAGLVTSSSALVTLTGVIWSNNEVGALIGEDAAGVALIGGTLSANGASPSVALDLLGERADRSAHLEGVSVRMRSTDAIARLDLRALDALTVQSTTLTGPIPPILVRGELAPDDAVVLAPREPFVRYALDSPARVGRGATLTLPDTIELRGRAGAALEIDGALVASAADVLDVPLRVNGGGSADLDGASWSLSPQGALTGCLLDAAGDARLGLSAASVRGHQAQGDGLCLDGPAVALDLQGATIEDFQRGLVLNDVGAMEIQGATLIDHRLAVEVRGVGAPHLSGNTFRSATDVQTLCVLYDVEAAPGGSVQQNTFELDNGDFAYHLDPDNFAQVGGTTFGPNTWSGHRPSGYLLSGVLTSTAAILTDLSELPAEANPFVTIQIPADLTVAPGSALRVSATDLQVFSLQGLSPGLGQTTLRVQGQLDLDGTGLLVSALPIRFEPGSGGTLTRVDFTSARTDFPILRIEDAAPRIGGSGSALGCSISGSALRDVIGVELRASTPMCAGGDSICPFIARNVFYNLAVGVRLYAPAEFMGVNEYDDANPTGDTVPINIDRR